MDIEFDPKKRSLTLRERGLDFADAWKLFDGRELTLLDDRFDYGEDRWLSYGWIDDVAVAVMWTDRNGARRVISMRRMHQWEIRHVGLD
jgi:uncharacterized DUF497 family protein